VGGDFPSRNDTTVVPSEVIVPPGVIIVGDCWEETSVNSTEPFSGLTNMGVSSTETSVLTDPLSVVFLGFCWEETSVNRGEVGVDEGVRVVKVLFVVIFDFLDVVMVFCLFFW